MNKAGQFKHKGLLALLAVLLAITAAIPARADDDRGRWDRGDQHDRRDQRYRHDERYRHQVARDDRREHRRRIPPGYIPARHGHQVYYLHRGHFYRDSPTGFISIGLPFGAIVASLPIGHVRVTIGGIGYFLADGVYYRPYVSGGYQVVAAPVPVAPAGATHSVTVSVGALNVRSGPGISFSVIGQVYQGASLYVHGNSPGWYYVQTPDGRYGWVMLRYVSPLPGEPQG